MSMRTPNSVMDLIGLILRSTLTKSQKLVAIAIADHADWTTGKNARPSVRILVECSSAGERTVQAALNELEALGVVVFPYGRKGGYSSKTNRPLTSVMELRREALLKIQKNRGATAAGDRSASPATEGASSREECSVPPQSQAQPPATAAPNHSHDQTQSIPTPSPEGDEGGNDEPFREWEGMLAEAGLARTDAQACARLPHMSTRQIEYAIEKSKGPGIKYPAKFIVSRLWKTPNELDDYATWKPKRRRRRQPSPREWLATLTPDERAEWIEKVKKHMRIPPNPGPDWWDSAICQLMQDETESVCLVA